MVLLLVHPPCSRHCLADKQEASGTDSNVGSKEGVLIKAPWDDEQLEMLRLRQGDTRKHPYTHTCGAILVPTHSGWICPNCTGHGVNMSGFGKAYASRIVQVWCHAEDLEVKS